MPKRDIYTTVYIQANLTNPTRRANTIKIAATTLGRVGEICLCFLREESDIQESLACSIRSLQTDRHAPPYWVSSQVEVISLLFLSLDKLPRAPNIRVRVGAISRI